MIYLINLLLVPIYYFLIKAFSRRKEIVNKLFFIVVGTHAVLFRALADPYVYVDTRGYAAAFSSIQTWSFKEAVLTENYFTNWGQGYVALNWLIGQFTSDPAYLFIVLAIVSVGGVIFYYYKTSYTPLLTVLFYLLYPMMYFQGFGVVRQHLAIVFVLWALYYMENLKIAIPLTVIGILCHTSTIIVVPFYFIRDFDIRDFNILKLGIYSLGGFLLASLGAGFMLSFFSRYETVLESEGEQHNIVPVVVIGITIISFLLSGILKKIKDKKDLYIIRFLIFGFIIALFGTTVPRAGRATLYFIYIVPVAFSLLYKYTSNKTKWISILYTLVLFAIEFLLVNIQRAKYQVYDFFWNN